MAGETGSAAEFVPASRALATLRRAAAGCRGCPLWRDATQTVFGTGFKKAPRAGEVEACKPWLEAELEAVRPSALLALGSTAAKALFGPSVRVTRDRGHLIDSPLAPVAALTMHPSAILRLRDHAEREDALAGLVADLRLVSRAAD